MGMVKYNELLLDTNFIIECTKRSLLSSAKALVPGARVVTLQAVADELERLGKGLALSMLKAEKVQVISIGGFADDAIFHYAEKGGVAVATNDKALTKRLRARGIAVIFPRGSGCGFAGGIA